MPENTVNSRLLAVWLQIIFSETNPSSNAVTASARGSFKPGISVPEPKREKEEASSLATHLKGIGKEIPEAGEAPQRRRRLQPTVICK